VTHHWPHPSSVHPRYAGDSLQCCVRQRPDGVGPQDRPVAPRTHDNFDYLVGQCRVVANPRGYALNRGQVGSRTWGSSTQRFSAAAWSIQGRAFRRCPDPYPGGPGSSPRRGMGRVHHLPRFTPAAPASPWPYSVALSQKASTCLGRGSSAFIATHGTPQFDPVKERWRWPTG
jgi:hypothetical protein